MWDIAREREKIKKRARERTFPQKALRHNLVCSQNKGVSEYQKRASQLRTGHSPRQRQRGRWAKPEPEGEGQSRPQSQHPPSNCEQAPSCYDQVFLGSWMVDVCQKGHSQRSAPQRRHMAHLRRHSHCAPGKLSGWDWGGGKTHHPPGESVLAKHLVT